VHDRDAERREVEGGIQTGDDGCRVIGLVDEDDQSAGFGASARAA
jgi:hypothetical protein